VIAHKRVEELRVLGAKDSRGRVKKGVKGTDKVTEIGNPVLFPLPWGRGYR
jgi:hypothetical protein